MFDYLTVWQYRRYSKINLIDDTVIFTYFSTIVSNLAVELHQNSSKTSNMTLNYAHYSIKIVFELGYDKTTVISA